MATKFATIHSGLLARKGEAAPAIASRLATYADAPPPVPPAGIAGCERRDVTQPPAGLPLFAAKPPARQTMNGHDGAAPVRLAVPAPEHDGEESEPEDIDGHAPDAEAVRYRLTVRLTREQRRRLRTAAAQLDCSLQHVLVDALDRYLDGLCACAMPQCHCLARRDGGSNTAAG